MERNIFELISFSPIGIKEKIYPVKYCYLCRGYLTDRCYSCTDKNSYECTVININDNYYHKHCHGDNNKPSKTN